MALAATTVTAGVTAASAEEEDVPPVVTLQSSGYVVRAPGYGVTLYASATEAELNTYLRIVDVDTGVIVANCFQATSCVGSADSDYSGRRTFIAYVVVASTSLPTDIRSASNPVAVYWHRPSIVTLVATPPVARVGEPIRIEARVDDTERESVIRIWDITNPANPIPVQQCVNNLCASVRNSTTAQSRDFVAHVSQSFNQPYSSYDGRSAVVRATWVDVNGSAVASSACDAGQQIVDSTTENVHVKMYVTQPSANETHVCVRAEDFNTGAGFGGQFVVTPTVPDADVTNVQVPTNDTQSGLCTTTTPNAVPGSHPITTGGVAGTPYMVDAYATTGEAWICLQAASTHVRLKVPVAVPNVSVNPGTQVQFVPDPGTPDVL